MFNVKDSVVAKEDIMTCRFEIVVKGGTLGTVLGKDEDEGLYLVVFDEGICGKKDPWWVKEHQIILSKPHKQTIIYSGDGEMYLDLKEVKGEGEYCLIDEKDGIPYYVGCVDREFFINKK